MNHFLKYSPISGTNVSVNWVYKNKLRIDVYGHIIILIYEALSTL